jgi:hypothetical protein
MVSQARPELLKSQANVNAGTTADAENQTAILNNSATASKKRVCHFLCIVASTQGAVFLWSFQKKIFL